ncbi:acyl-CoA thioesterase YbgC [Caulifigura coniformis]|uniref:Acyl-CoA thioesterase YbgC n=1 Tax=Caulifigura coniformis TaxID=2527983 RepID=A0A517SG23_9PLAN|nr:thioesterase family protein [Caulifigura coniformis]QDT55074.1 acyl-CoA thioesterase YbgC [Caulifigura coniformis]
MPDIYFHEHTVHADEIDPLGHANNVSFVKWMQDAAIAHSTAQGWPMSRYREHGVAWVVRRHTVEYLLPAVEGERIVVKTWVADMQRVTSLRRYEISTTDRLLARAETNWAFIRTGDGKLTRIPEHVSASFVLVPGT